MHTNPLLIVNPGSGGYSGCRIAHISAELARIGLSPRIISVRTPKETADSLCYLRSSSEQQFIIVAAGDGTFNAVLNCVGSGTAILAVLPLGTSNVMAAELGITSLDDGIQRIARFDTRSLPLGLLQLERTQHYFALMAGVGLDGAIVRDVQPNEKGLLKQGAFVLSALRNIRAWDREMFKVTIGDKTISCHTVVACNASRYGGNFVLAREGDLFSPVFIAVCVTTNSCAGYLRIAYNLFRGKTFCRNDVTFMVSNEIKIHGTKPIQIDGDFVGYGPARLTIVPDTVRIIV